MKLLTTSYLTQTAQLPQAGRYIVAQYDETLVVVYQAYRPAFTKCVRSTIAHFAVEHGYFSGEFSFKVSNSN